MKLTKSQLKKIIKEEVDRVLSEMTFDPAAEIEKVEQQSGMRIAYQPVRDELMATTSKAEFDEIMDGVYDKDTVRENDRENPADGRDPRYLYDPPRKRSRPPETEEERRFNDALEGEPWEAPSPRPKAYYDLRRRKRRLPEE
jgi:hypothetical protein